MSPRLDWTKPREREPRAVKEVAVPLTPKQVAVASKMRKDANKAARKAQADKKWDSPIARVARKRLKNRKKRLARKLKAAKTLVREV